MSAFITFEGCEGVGKSTQLRFLKEYLESTEQDAVFTREPGGTELAEKIRELILTQKMSAECEALLFAAARCEHINNFIIPNLREGKTVVCDRYLYSSVAYQGYARKLGKEKVLDINFYAVEKMMPDAVVFIDMDPLDSWRRRKGKVVDNDRMEAEDDEFHSAVYRGFRELAQSDGRFISIVPDVDKEVTAKKIRDALKERGLIK